MTLYDPYDAAIQEDPFPVYRRLRDEAPTYWNPDRRFWALSRFEDLWTAVHDHARFSSAQGIVLGQDVAQDVTDLLPMMIMMDPPRHDQLRRLVSRAFAPRSIAAMEASIRAVADELIDTLPAEGGDFVELYAGRLPMTVIAVMLGVPVEDRGQFRGWSDDLAQVSPDDPASVARALQGSAGILGYLPPLLEERRVQPRDDLISALLAAEIDGERLGDSEILGTCFLLLTAGNETTTNLISNALMMLEQQPDVRRQVIGDRSLLPSFIEEVLRLESPVQGLTRTLTENVVMHGERMSAGDKVLLLYGSANRDEREYPDADTLVMGRRCERALAFGHGIHYCLGASLARLESRIAFEQLFERVPDIRIAEGAQRVHSGPIRGFERLPVQLPGGTSPRANGGPRADGGS